MPRHTKYIPVANQHKSGTYSIKDGNRIGSNINGSSHKPIGSEKSEPKPDIDITYLWFQPHLLSASNPSRPRGSAWLPDPMTPSWMPAPPSGSPPRTLMARSGSRTVTGRDGRLWQTTIVMWRWGRRRSQGSNRGRRMQWWWGSR